MWLDFKTTLLNIAKVKLIKLKKHNFFAHETEPLFYNGFNAATAPLGIKIRSSYTLSSKVRLFRKEKTKIVGNQPSLALARRSSTDNAVVVFGVFRGTKKLYGRKA